MNSAAPARGRFLVFEGIDGAGKSTQLPRVAEWLRRDGVSVRETREPGGTPFGERLRDVLVDSQYAGMSSVAELLIVFAARAEHLAQVIEPALAAGNWVLCDRFTDATFAYQGGGRSLEPVQIAGLEETVQGDLRPDLVLILDIPVEIGLARVRRRDVRNRFEREGAAFFERVREVYLQRARQRPGGYAIIEIDAQTDEATVTKRIIDAIKERRL